MTNFIKPDLSMFFAGITSANDIWMRSEYENAKNYAQCVNVMHNWYNIAGETNNIVKKDSYNRGASLLQEKLTNQILKLN